jgi:hypothetical protein
MFDSGKLGKTMDTGRRAPGRVQEKMPFFDVPPRYGMGVSIRSLEVTPF